MLDRALQMADVGEFFCGSACLSGGNAADDFVSIAEQEDRVLNHGVRPVGAATALLGAAMLTLSVPRFRKLLD
jgi:hypothetical protein